VGGIAVECDVSDCKSVERMARQVEAAHGRLDLLVSNAGISIEDDASWELPPPNGGGYSRSRAWASLSAAAP
jgi:NAD(P)-dependent dehydrogenase (short-subunit alcohol dehydrogenase family)